MAAPQEKARQPAHPIRLITTISPVTGRDIGALHGLKSYRQVGRARQHRKERMGNRPTGEGWAAALSAALIGPRRRRRWKPACEDSPTEALRPSAEVDFYASPLARACSRAMTAQSQPPSPWATAPTRRSRQTLALGSGTPAASPAASARLASFSPRTAIWPTFS